MSGMDVEHLRWFVSVAAREHVTDAAAELHVTQPALSRALARLEAEVGVALFDRRGRTVRLNRYGAAFRLRVERALAELDEGRRELAEGTSPDSGIVGLAFGATFGTWRVPELLAAYRAIWPLVGFHLREGTAGEMRNWLLDGDVDLILTSTQPSGRHLLWRPLTRERLALVVPAGHPLAQRDSVRLRDIADEPLVALKPGFGLRALGDDLCRRAGFAPHIAVESEDPATVRSLVATGLGVALVPARHSDQAEAPIPIRYLPVRDRDAVRTIGMAWITTRYQSPAVEQFRKFALNYWT
jgi:LysR family transcriptional regulator, transcription activator of glutamate synthase operon